MTTVTLPPIVVLLKGYPRLSETFIAQELLGLEQAGLDLRLVSMRRPTDRKRHPIHDEIRAPVAYLPEYLHEEPLRVLRGLWRSAKRPGFGATFRAFLGDLRRDPTRNRLRRFGQAAVLVAAWPEPAGWLYAHFIHTPASVAQYAAAIAGLPWSASAHAKDIWTSPDWDLTQKLHSARWTVTCTEAGRARLAALSPEGRVHLSYHGLDLGRFPPSERAPSTRDGSDPSDPLLLLSVGRAVPKKGYDILLQALASLPEGLHWRLIHVGGGSELERLRALADTLGLADRIEWRGPMDQREVLELYRTADLFVLACRVTDDGDRDGLPNVLVEAASQRLACVSTDISGIGECFTDGETALLVPPEDPAALSRALERAMRDPAERARLGAAAEARVRADFDMVPGIRHLKALFQSEWDAR